MSIFGTHFDKDPEEYDKPIIGRNWKNDNDDNDDYDHSIMYRSDDHEKDDDYDQPIIGFHNED
jgi:hypothetical protein